LVVKRRSGFLWFLLVVFLFAVMAGGCGGSSGSSAGGGNPGAPNDPGGGGGGGDGGGNVNLTGTWNVTEGGGEWYDPVSGEFYDYIDLTGGTLNVGSDNSITCSLSGTMTNSKKPFLWAWSAQNPIFDDFGPIYMTSNERAASIQIDVLLDVSPTEVLETITMKDGSTMELHYTIVKQP
jgi:hypothetical protein